MKSIFTIILIIICAIVFIGCAGNNKYIKKDNKIYWVYYAGPMPMFGLDWERHEMEVEDVDIETFIDFEIQAYAKDKNHIYFIGKIMKNECDVTTFEILSHSYARDKNHVYHISSSPSSPSILEGADPETFIAIGKYRGKDANHLFERWRIVDEFIDKK
jgi:hypothetical protein